MAKYNHTYLLEIELEDGTRMKQNPLDHSEKEPPVLDENGEYQGKSWHADIREYEENLKIVRAWLIGVDMRNIIMVDLRTGLFEINGLQVLLENEKIPVIPPRFQLVYYKQVTHDRHITIDTKEMKEIETKDDPPFVEYFLGWKFIYRDKEYKQKIAVA